MIDSRSLRTALLLALVLAPFFAVIAGESCRLWIPGRDAEEQGEVMDCAKARFEAARIGAFVIDSAGRIVGVGKPRFFARVGDAPRPQGEGEPLLSWEAPEIVEGLEFVDESDRLAPSSKDALLRLVGRLRSDEGGIYEIGVYSESHGDPRYDELLTRMQAEALRDLLIERGVEADRLRAKGYGSSGLNARVELRRLD